ncbi:hypothetical protein [Amycolatopsis pithecellobii]|uniref:Uncharacterized protein n=1 Tax=Amycolatopsis pithecellobii TaxID=664692 RepID=A0A6N7ZAQ5_9PSEU|nr:hypothetical protein [Amycolatopsis pithecellobii]MTD58768.1 hypothetical protein [Amycolatopsis pithecellobii]
MSVETEPPAWREFPSGLVPPVDGPVQCAKCQGPARLYVLDVREDMWFACLDHHTRIVLDLLTGRLDDHRPPEHDEAAHLSSTPFDQERMQAWREVLAFRAQIARLRALTDQLRFVIYALDETATPLRQVIDADADLAELGDSEVRNLPDNFEAATRSARAVERVILDFVRALPPESPSGSRHVQ